MCGNRASGSGPWLTQLCSPSLPSQAAAVATAKCQALEEELLALRELQAGSEASLRAELHQISQERDQALTALTEARATAEATRKDLEEERASSERSRAEVAALPSRDERDRLLEKVRVLERRLAFVAASSRACTVWRHRNKNLSLRQES